MSVVHVLSEVCVCATFGVLVIKMDKSLLLLSLIL